MLLVVCGKTPLKITVVSCLLTSAVPWKSDVYRTGERQSSKVHWSWIEQRIGRGSAEQSMLSYFLHRLGGLPDEDSNNVLVLK